MYKAHVLVVLALLCVCAAVPAARADTSGFVTLFGSRFSGSASAFTQSNVDISRTNAERLCADRGGVLPTDRGATSRSQLEQVSILTPCAPDVENGSPTGKYKNCLGFYTAGTAQPTIADGSCAMTERVRELTPNAGRDTLTDSDWDTGCNYRWNVGWYDRFTYAGEPGTGVWKSTWGHINTGLAITSVATLGSSNVFTRSIYVDGALNGYTDDHLWNLSHQCAPDGSVYNPACIPPHGYFYLMAGRKQLYGSTIGYSVRVDVPEVYNTNYPYTRNNVVLVCEYQGTETDFFRSTTAQPQPAFRQGWKDETWAQKNWWVIFLIVAIILLALILTIAIYCVCTRRQPPTGPLLHSLVVRERDGHGYIVVDDEEDDMADVNKNPLNPANSGYPQPNTLYPDGAAGQNNGNNVRSGFGFNRNAQPQHDDPGNHMAPGFYNNGNNMQYNPNGNNGNQMPAAMNMDMPGYSTEPPPAEPEAAPEAAPEEDGELSKAPSALSRRRSSRRGKGRAASQTFSEVDLPQAGEIGEDNVEL